ncbi:MAG: hypothetical protein AAF226_13180 [Verrucomicrobiota bacterium]
MFPKSASKRLNAIIALIYLVLSITILIDDIRYPGDFLFQSSGPLVGLTFYGLFLMAASLVLFALPKRFLFPLGMLIITRMGYGFPISAITGVQIGVIINDVTMLILAAWYLSYAFFTKKGLNRRWIRWQHSLWVAVLAVLSLLLIIPISFGGALSGSKELLGAYVELKPTSISALERVFEKDGKKVHLIGMMHIGESSFYEDLNRRMGAKTDGGRLVLTEGVSDANQLLPEEFANGEMYRKFAAILGLENQKEFKPETESGAQAEKDVGEKWRELDVTMVNADGDISDLSEKHQQLLIASLKQMSAMVDAIYSGDPTKFILQPQGPQPTGLDIEDLFKEGLLKKRNDILMQRFDEYSSDFAEINVPCGAAHLADIEARLIERGYRQISEESRPIVRFFK